MNEVLAMAVSPAAVPAVPLDTHPDGRGSSEKAKVLSWFFSRTMMMVFFLSFFLTHLQVPDTVEDSERASHHANDRRDDLPEARQSAHLSHNLSRLRLLCVYDKLKLNFYAFCPDSTPHSSFPNIPV